MKIITFKGQTHKTGIKELINDGEDRLLRRLTSRHLCIGQKAALERTAKTTAIGQLACTFYVRGNNSPHITGRARTADIQAV